MNEQLEINREELNQERRNLLVQIEDVLEVPMLILGFVWLALLIFELIWGASSLLEWSVTIIWVIFVLDFVIKFLLTPSKWSYLQSNWLTALSLLVPALRLFRIFRVARILGAARGLRLFRIIASLNRGMKALRASFGRRGFGYIVVLTTIVVFAGAAGMFAFENEVEGGIQSYESALWWTAMMITTIGSEYFPQTIEGRILCFFLALYGFAVFGYMTATLATFFVGRDAENSESELVGADDIKALRGEIAQLRHEIALLRER